MKTIILDGTEYELVPVQKKDGGGWIKWEGGECPVAGGVLVDVRYRDGLIRDHLPANEDKLFGRDAGPAFWRHDDHFNDIVAYRLSEGA